MTESSEDLDRAIDRARQTYLELVREIETMSPSAEAVPALIASAEEFGVVEAMKTIGDASGIPDGPAPSPEISQARLAQLVDVGHDLDQLIGARERFLFSQDKRHSRVFAFQGHDARLDERIAMTIERVEPRAKPDFDYIRALEIAAAPEASKTRKRSRSRSREAG